MNDTVDKEGCNKCVFCGQYPYISHFASNMYYVICSNPNCKTHIKFGTYNCLGSTKKLAIDQWNIQNREINRIVAPKKKK